MIPSTTATPGLRAGLATGLTNGVAVISPATVLPTISDANTAIDGTRQTAIVGNTNNIALGNGGTVGVNATALSQLNGPEVQLVGPGATSAFNGLTLAANNTTITGLAIYGFGNSASNTTSGNIYVTTGATSGTLITGNVIGTTARSFSDPGATTRSAAHGIFLQSSGDVTTLFSGTISNNLIGYNATGGIELIVNSNGNGTSTGYFVEGNEIRGNAISNSSSDGIRLGVNGGVVRNNLFAANQGPGVDLAGSTGNALVTNNTISNNGLNGGGQTPGVRLQGTANTISQNIISNNYGAGILAQPSTTNSTFSQNSIFGNGSVLTSAGGAASGQIGIDLESSTDNTNQGTSPFVTLNDNGDADTGANGLTNMPIVQTATIRNGMLYLTGFARPGALLEFFISAPNAASLNAVGANFGQGQTYLFSRTEGTTGNPSATLNDLDATTGNYTGLINGFNQGTETGQNRFSYAIALSALTSGQQAALTAGTAKLTATATQVTLVNGNQGTSEFSGNAPVQLAPVANNDFASTTPGTAVTLSITDNDQNGIDGGTVAVNGQAAGGTTAVTVTGGTFTFLGNGQVSFVPAAGFTGVATVPYTVNNTSGITSNTAFISVAVSGTTFNLATSFSTVPAATVNAGSSVSYTVVSSNPGTVAATNVIETVQLPAGLSTGFTVGGSAGTPNASTGITTFAGGSYNQNTGLLTLTIGNLAANGGSASTALTFPAPLNSPLVVTANISGAGGVETTTTDNTIVSKIDITPRFDVTTAIGGPTTVTAGNEVTYTVVTNNLSGTTTPANVNSISPAVNVEQTVTLQGNLTGAGIYASNGGMVAYNSTLNVTVVTFPAIGVLAAGQSQVNTITFTAPNTSFSAPTAVVTSGFTGSNTGDLNSPTAGTDNNTAQLNGAATRPTITPATRTGTAANVYTNISASAANVAPGANITLTIMAGNAGAAAASGVQQTISLPTGLTFSNLGGGSYNAVTGVLTFPALTSPLAAGATQPYTVTFAAPQQGFVLATAAVTTTTPDAIPADNLAQTKVEVTPLVDVATTLAGPVVALPGQTVSYTVTTASNGPAAADGVVQTVQLPTGLTNVQLNSLSAGSQYNATTGTLTIRFPDPLATGFSQTNTISFTAPAGAANLNVSAAVSTSSAETVVTNNAATVVTALTPAADVAIQVTGPPTVTVGNPVPYVVSTTNNGAAVATSVIPTLQLPAGLGTANVTFPAGAATGSYNNATGLVTFSTVAVLASGATTSSVIVVTMPDASQLSAVGQVTTTSTDTNPTNNYATAATTATTVTTATADLRTTLTPATTTVNAGSSVTLTATFSNLGAGTATNVVPQLLLQPGLTGVTVTDNGTVRNADYNATTGVVTFQSTAAALASLASGSSLPGTYTVSFNAPATGPVSAVASIYSATSDGVLSNNTASATVNVTPQADAQTSIAGPLTAQPGSRVTYEITTSNNSTAVSPSTNVVQTVTIPGTPANLTFSAGASSAVVGANTVVTFPTVASMAPGVAGAVTNFISFTTPATATTLNITANVTSAADINISAASNSASISTIANNAPVAYNVVNNLLPAGEVRFNQVIENTATTAQPISPLVATDVNAGQTLSYTLASVPTSGGLYIGTSTTALISGATISASEAGQLRYLPVSGFIGNAFFTYTATDNATPTSATSNVALYTIAVGQDANSSYTTTPVKGGASPYLTGDVLANVFDANSGTYNSATPQAVVKDGVSSATLVTTGLPAGVSGSFPPGVDFNTTNPNQIGQIVVTNNRLLVAGTYTVQIRTIDANGGTNTQNVTFTIGVRPLPVQLASFTAKAAGPNAELTWRTAQELRNDHFVVERSFDGRSFSALGQVQGQGTTTLATDYQFLDAQVAAKAAGQTVYYRLRQVDTDGTSSFSAVQAVAFTKTEVAISLYPNPASTSTTLNLTSLPQGAYQVSIIDAVGRVVRQARYEGGTTPTLSVQELPVGSYQVLISGASFNKSLRFIKE
ncbi:right-handed parallel beta-helix repeat-containing protein [Hymenobacter sp. 5414T-23]|nr:right-handed parallel beta-helix repeat-containing protein [Hymenobacter sp. 5414T-23]UOQ80468.1 right-handed parallel beta-helix repeat-containing protein [Hymenobacter sp. 5414T-23]